MVDQKRFLIEQRFNRIVVFFYCLLIFFLPISIALIESMAGFVILFFVLKKITLAVYDIKALKHREPGTSAPSKLSIVIASFYPERCYLNKFVGIFILAVLISVFRSAFLNVSLLAFVAKLLEGYFLYFSFVDCVNTKRYLRSFLIVYLASVFLMAVNGLTQYVTHTEFVRGTPLADHRVSSSLRHANDFGAYLIWAILSVLGLLFAPLKRISLKEEWRRGSFASSPWFKAGGLALLLLSVVCLGLTFSRASWVGFLLALAVLGFSSRRFLVVTIVSGVFFMALFMPLLVKNRNVSFISDSVRSEKDQVNLGVYIQELTQKNVSQLHQTVLGDLKFTGMGRSAFWAEAIKVIKQAPFFGNGLNTYSLLTREFGYPHNCYLQMVAEIGIVGTSAFFLMIGMLLIRSFSALSSMENDFAPTLLAGAVAGLVGFLAQSFFDTSLYSVQLSNLMWIFMGLIIALGRLPKDLTKAKGSL